MLVIGEQRRDGPTHKAELTVVIILQNIPPLPLVGPAQQLMAAGNRHDDAGGIVVAGGDMHHVGVGAAQRLVGKAALIQRHIPQRHLIAPVDPPDLAVAGILHGIALLPAQQLDQQKIQRFRSGTYDDLSR